MVKMVEMENPFPFQPFFPILKWQKKVEMENRAWGEKPQAIEMVEMVEMVEMEKAFPFQQFFPILEWKKWLKWKSHFNHFFHFKMAKI